MSKLQDSIILFFVCIISFILIKFIFVKTKSKINLPPSPRALPVIGHLHHLGTLPHQAFHKLSNIYGPLVYLLLGSKPCLVVSSPEMAKEVLKTHESSFLDRPRMSNINYLTYGSSDFTLAPYGPYWRFMKKICMTELLGGPTLDKLLPLRHKEMKHFVKIILKKAMGNEAVDVGAELTRLTNNIITCMAFNKRCSDNDGEAEEVRKLVKEMTELAGKFNVSDMIWFCRNLDLQGFRKRLKDVRDRYDGMMERIIKEHEEERTIKKIKGEETVRDLLDILLDIYGDESSEIKLTRENIKAFIMNIFGAGTDTSATTTEWALAELINHPQVMEKARKEIDSLTGTNRLVEESDIVKLPYLQAIVKETLRLHPTGPLIVRESTESCTIAGYDIPARAKLFVNVWSLGRDPKHWDNPLEFIPERFLGTDGNGKRHIDVRGQHFQFLPFGSGRRSCPGASLAMLVIQTSLAILIKCFEWKVGDGGDCSLDMDEGPGISLPRAHPLMCIPVPRLNPFPSL